MLLLGQQVGGAVHVVERGPETGLGERGPQGPGQVALGQLGLGELQLGQLLVGQAGAEANQVFIARSAHPGGVNVLSGDGSVRFIKNTIAINTWRALSSSQGGEVISADQF